MRTRAKMDCPVHGAGAPMRTFRCAGCNGQVLACARCSTDGKLAAEHGKRCKFPPSREPVSSGGSVFRGAASLGGNIGAAARGRGGAAFGTVLGAALGALFDHVLTRPEIAPAGRAARTIFDVVADARRHWKKSDIGD